MLNTASMLCQIPEDWSNWVAEFDNLGWESWIAQIFTLNFSSSVFPTSSGFSRSWGRFSNQLPVSQWQRHAIDLKLRLRAKSKFQYEDTLQPILSPQQSEILNTIGESHFKNMEDVDGHIDSDVRFRAWCYDLGEVVALALLARTCVTLHFTVWAA